MNVTPESIAYYVRKSLASYLCTHDPEASEMKRPCRKCMATVEPLVLPVAKALTWTIVESRIVAGSSVDILVRDAEFELQQFIRKPPASEGIIPTEEELNYE